MEIRHLALASDWEAARAAGSYRVSGRGMTLEDEGFLHCSFPEQTARVAARVWGDAPDALMLLEIDADAVEAGGTAVLVETAKDGEGYPHIHGALDPACVIRALPARMVDGALVVAGE